MDFLVYGGQQKVIKLSFRRLKGGEILNKQPEGDFSSRHSLPTAGRLEMTRSQDLTEKLFRIYLDWMQDPRSKIQDARQKNHASGIIHHLSFDKAMLQTLQLGKTKRIFVQEPDKETVTKLAQEYNFHEMIVDDLLELNAQSKIDINSEHFFLTLTFTKYIASEERYKINELDVIIGEDYIITTISFESESFNNLFATIQSEAKKIDGSYKSSPYYLLYRIIDCFYDKTNRTLAFSSKKLLDIQDNIANRKVEKKVIEDLMDEDLNKIFVKHNFLSQEDVIDDLAKHVNSLHEKHLNVYFNNLRGKLAKIISTVKVLTEKTESLMSAYNIFVGIKNNNSVTRLTFVNAIFMPLTLIAGIGGMSERSMMTGPENWKIAYPLFLLLCLAIAYITFLLLRKFFLKK